MYAASQWLILVIIAKMMRPSDLGQFALGLALTAPIMIFAYNGLRELQATDARGHFTFSDYLRFRAVSVTLALIVIAIVTRAFHVSAVVLVVGLSKAVESFCDLLYGQYQQHERMDWIATSLMLRGLFSVIAVFVLVRSTHSIEWTAAGLMIGNAVVLAFYDRRQAAWLINVTKTDNGIGTSSAIPLTVGGHRHTS